MSKTVEIVSAGESWEVKYLNRSYGGGPAVNVLRVGGEAPLPGVLTYNGQPVQAMKKLLHGYAVGGSAAGSIVVAGAKVGDKVIQVMETSTPFTDVTASFESVVSVAGHVQQLSTDLHLFTLLFAIAQQS